MLIPAKFETNSLTQGNQRLILKEILNWGVEWAGWVSLVLHFCWQVSFLEGLYWLQSRNEQNVDFGIKFVGPYHTLASTVRRLLSLALG